MATNIYDITVTTIDGEQTNLSFHQGHPMLIVNVASQCGFTKQYAGLEALYKKYKDKGFSVLGFPCNQFGAQEPGSEAEVKQFCENTYAVTFPLFAKVAVNGVDTHPLYKLLKSQQKGLLGSEKIKWNFTKFLINSKGEVCKRYAPTTTPEAIAKDIEALL